MYDLASCGGLAASSPAAAAEAWQALRCTTVDDLGGYSCSSKGLVKPPFYFGQASCLSGQPCPATVVARDCTQLYSLSRADLLQVGWWGRPGRSGRSSTFCDRWAGLLLLHITAAGGACWRDQRQHAGGSSGTVCLACSLAAQSDARRPGNGTPGSPQPLMCPAAAATGSGGLARGGAADPG
jgi:hypothetical protein